MKKTYFTPGPAELFPTVEQHYKNAFDLQLGSISHRSAQFKKIYQFTVEQLRVLLNIPDTAGIFFTSSATEIWERIIMNTVEHESYHLVNGSFSKKFYDFSAQLHKFAHKFEKPFGQGFDYQEVEVPKFAELICCTANETSSGVQMRKQDIQRIKRSHKDKIVAVDMVSSAPYPDFDFDLIDTAFFSVQKSFGMPAGLGVWIDNGKCLEKSLKINANEGTTGTYHNLPTLWKNYETFETPETPNVMAIYVLGKVAEDMNKIGIDKIRKQTERKAEYLYSFLENAANLQPFVQNKNHQSQTVVVADVLEGSATALIEKVKESNIVLGSGYGQLKASQIRIANFPAVSFEQVEQLVALLGQGN
jgi:phosphoserine aminotransferase